jgi:hypothetical protein
MKETVLAKLIFYSLLTQFVYILTFLLKDGLSIVVMK